MRSENERQPAWVASTCKSLRCKLYTLLFFSIQHSLTHIYIYGYINKRTYSLYAITPRRSGTRPVAKPLRSIRPEHCGTRKKITLKISLESLEDDPLSVLKLFVDIIYRWEVIEFSFFNMFCQGFWQECVGKKLKNSIAIPWKWTIGCVKIDCGHNFWVDIRVETYDICTILKFQFVIPVGAKRLKT
jgi:hypothetical protein